MPVQDVPFLPVDGELRLLRNKWYPEQHVWEPNHPFRTALTICSWENGTYGVRRDDMPDRVYWIAPSYMLTLMQSGLLDGDRTRVCDWTVTRRGTSYFLELNR